MSLYLPFTSFFFNHTATTEIYTLSLHDALPISVRLTSRAGTKVGSSDPVVPRGRAIAQRIKGTPGIRSEEHTSELQSLRHLVCRLLLEKKKRIKNHSTHQVILVCRVHVRCRVLQ